jgi:hypothetical protein
MCRKITNVIGEYLWGGDDFKRKIHWKKWCDIAILKAMEEMGFCDLQILNQVILSKQGWRLSTKSDLLCAMVLKGK